MSEIIPNNSNNNSDSNHIKKDVSSSYPHKMLIDIDNKNNCNASIQCIQKLELDYENCYTQSNEFPKTRKRCPKCNRKGLKLECKYCNESFCYSCHLPEIHDCLNLQKCVSEKKQTLSTHLLNNRCVSKKVTDI